MHLQTAKMQDCEKLQRVKSQVLSAVKGLWQAIPPLPSGITLKRNHLDVY